METDTRLRDLEKTQAVQGEQISTHKAALDNLTEHLERMLSRVDRFEKLFAFGVLLIFSGTVNGQKALEKIAGLFF